MQRILIFWLLLILGMIHWIQAHESIQYFFPVHNSTLNSRTSPIIIRPGTLLDPATIDYSKQILVKGSESGVHTGQIIFSSDKRTLIFKADRAFNPAETVTVNFLAGVKTLTGGTIPAFSYHFTVTPLQAPLNPYKYIPESNPVQQLLANNDSGIQNNALGDSLPPDFPRFTLEVFGTPAAGYLFISPTHFINGEGYNLMIKNSGELAYYKKIEDGVPVDFKVLPTGQLAYGQMFEFHTFVGGGPANFHVMDSSFSIVDTYQMGNEYLADSHEFQLLPNGHALMLSYDVQPVDMSQLVPGGHPGAMVAGSIIQELDVDKNVIFQWRSWDYFALTDSYNDLTLSLFDAIHINSLEMDHDKHLLVSTMALGEITKINRQTGDIIWRMGGKNNQFTFVNESTEFAPLYFMFQHDVRRIDNGNITMFDGGDHQMRPYSRVVEYQVDEVNKTVTKVWEYRHQPDIFTATMGNAQRLPNGHTLVGWGIASMYGHSAVTEVDANGNVVLELKFKALLQASYRAFRFNWDGGRPAANVLRYELLPGNTYSFDDEGQKTGISIKLNKMDGFGYNEARVKRYTYAPLKPQFLNKAPVVLPARIVVSQFNISNINGEISFDVDFYQFDQPESLIVYHREFEGNGLFEPLPTTYNHVTRKVIANMTKFGEFIFAYPDFQLQVFPPLLVSPIHSSAVDITKPVKLEWTPVGYVMDYQLQVATENNFANPVVDEEYLTEAVFYFTASTEPKTYYWRVKTFNDVGESAWSAVQTFRTQAPYIKVTFPNGNERLQRGLEHFIKWDDILEENVSIELYRDNSFVRLIDTTYSSGGYAWDIPANLALGANYKILIKSVANSSISDMSDAAFAIVDTVAAVQNLEPKLVDFQLHQNFPNPFNAVTKISYQLPSASFVSLKIFDIQGRVIQTLVNERQPANSYEISFDASKLAAGIYFYQLRAGAHFTQTRKLLFIK